MKSKGNRKKYKGKGGSDNKNEQPPSYNDTVANKNGTKYAKVSVDKGPENGKSGSNSSVVALPEYDPQLASDALDTIQQAIAKQTAVPDYYSILGVTSSANQKQLGKAYRRRIAKYGKLGRTPNKQKMAEVDEAYQFLTSLENNPTKQAQYAKDLANYQTSTAGIAAASAVTLAAVKGGKYIPSKRMRILIIILIGIVVMLIAGFFWVEGNISTINQNWEQYRCRPYVFPFVGWLVGPPGVTMTQNTGHCLWELQKGFFWVLMHPFLAIFDTIKNILLIIRDAIADIWITIEFVRDVIGAIAMDIYTRLRNTFLRIAFLFNSFVGLLNRILITFQDIMNVGLYTYYTFASLWNGILGKMLRFMRFFCNHQDNMISVRGHVGGSSKFNVIPIKNVVIGNTLRDGSRVTGTIKYYYAHPKTHKPFVQLYHYKNNMITGSHLVENEIINSDSSEKCAILNNNWIKCQDSKDSTPISQEVSNKIAQEEDEVICLITDTGKVQMHDHLQTDYFEEVRPEGILPHVYKLLIGYINTGKIVPQDKMIVTPDKQQLWGLHGSSPILLYSGDLVNIKEIKMGDKLSDGRYVIGKAEFEVNEDSWFYYNGVIATKSLVVKDINDRLYKPISECYKASKVTIINDLIAYNLIMDKGNEFTCMGVPVRDFEMAESRELDEYLSNLGMTTNQI